MLRLGTQRVNDLGHLEIGGCDTVELARQFGTPLYVLDEALIRDMCRKYVTAFNNGAAEVQVAYAGKAFLTTAMCRIVQQEGLWLDVCSAGELHTAIRAAFPPDRILFHGNYKSEQELRTSVELPVGRIVIDSVPEIGQVNALGREVGRPVDVQIRLSPGIKAQTHDFIQTGQLDSKFGVSIETGQAMEAVKLAQESPFIRLRGFHCHIGSQIFGIEAFERAVAMMAEFIAESHRQNEHTPEELNLGGGLGIRYTQEDVPPPLEHFADLVIGALKAATAKHDLPPLRLMLEPGRSIVGEAGTTLYTIGVIKDIPSVRRYISVDGGLSDNPRPGLYDARYEAAVANRAAEPLTQTVTVAGKHCETDTLIRDVRLQDTEPGDILAVFSTGAYNYSMASNYNRFPRPAVVLVADGHADVIVERETLDDLVAKDRIPPRLQQAGV
jgi:diaminopimelate decarboxylase